METNAQELERRIEALEYAVRLLLDVVIEMMPPEDSRRVREMISKQKVGDEP